MKMQKAQKLLRIFGYSGKDTGSGSAIVECAFDEDFSSWEFVIPSDDDDDNVAYFFSDEDDLEIGMQTDGSSDEFFLEQGLSSLLGSPSGVSMESHSPDQISGLLDVASVALEDYGGESAYGSEYAPEEEDEDDDDYDVDDELVPYWARDKFAKQRMKKLDNMALLRMKKPKRLPYYCNKPGSAWKVR
ncbi:unnamed protein product [Cuscuta campestris]|uniref:Uncharacterized protein n=1 Tax=Cuscuta campestris TaxID=132261 RepID=A0A484L751_9ASTE|nr:unnamed protein product [Cuscuta campestris]